MVFFPWGVGRGSEADGEADEANGEAEGEAEEAAFRKAPPFLLVPPWFSKDPPASLDDPEDPATSLDDSEDPSASLDDQLSTRDRRAERRSSSGPVVAAAARLW